MTVAAKTDWHLRGEWFDVCSCKLPCPCSFAQEPTHGDCLFTLVWQVHEGHYGTTDLSGLGVVALGEFAGNMWIGDPDATMKLMFYIDEKADADQRAALERIFRGDEGGWPGEFGSLISELRGIEYAPINFIAADDLAYWRAEIPGKVDVRVDALTGPTADPKRRVTTVNAPGAEVGPGQVASWGVGKRGEGGFHVEVLLGFPASSKHFPFDWRPDGTMPVVEVTAGGTCCCN